jgi:predicted transcriptional regulator
VGLVSEADIMAWLGSGEGSVGSLVSKCMNRQVTRVGVQTPISALEEWLRKSTAVVVVDEASRPISILTRIDLLHFMTATPAQAEHKM